MTAALRHRQSNPLYVLSKGIQFAREAADTLARRDQQAATDVWLDSSLYPDYYKNTFHYRESYTLAWPRLCYWSMRWMNFVCIGVYDFVSLSSTG